MSRIISLSILTLSCFTFGNYSLADIGGDRLVANSTGRCWRVLHRDFAIKGNFVAGYAIKMLNVGGSGETDDIITYQLTIKEDYTLDDGWDESKTRQYTGSGLVKTIVNGRIHFEIYVDTGTGGSPITVQGYYHPGNGTSDADDRIILEIPLALQSGSTGSSSNNSDCEEEEVEDPEILEEGNDSW